MLQEDKDKKCMETLYATICQRVTMTEDKCLGLIEAEKTHAHAIVMQARRVTNSICIKREMEIKNLKEKFENQLQRLCKHGGLI
jgi:cobalamin-dependent methionine synthase I